MYPQEIRRTTMRDIRQYWAKREPWAFADTYVVDTEFKWCITVTHDDICYYSQPDAEDGAGS
jgi:hypothetical protein